jgi:hypothetical protein
VNFAKYIADFSDDQVTAALYMAMGILVMLAFLAKVRSRKYVRRNGWSRFTRFNPYNHLRPCAPMTDAERQVYRNLVMALSPALVVSFQTAMSAMVTHDAKLPSCRIGLVRNTFNRLRVDFALYHFGTNKVLAVVELDDRTHASRQQQQEDARRDRILLAVGIKVVRVRYGQETTPQALAERFAGFIPHRS